MQTSCHIIAWRSALGNWPGAWVAGPLSLCYCGGERNDLRLWYMQSNRLTRQKRWRFCPDPEEGVRKEAWLSRPHGERLIQRMSQGPERTAG